MGVLSQGALYALDPFDPREWYPETLMRFRKHHAAAAGFKFTFIVATYLIQDDALKTEEYLAAELGAATGLLRLNAAPYRKGRLNRAGADGYAVYVQAKYSVPCNNIYCHGRYMVHLMNLFGPREIPFPHEPSRRAVHFLASQIETTGSPARYQLLSSQINSFCFRKDPSF